MGSIGNCCCCPITGETLPDWQIDGFTVTTDWNNQLSGGGNACCWNRTYTVNNGEHISLQVTDDITRFWVNEQSKTVAKAFKSTSGWIWKGANPPTTLPPRTLCNEDAADIGYRECNHTFEQKKRGYMYSQPTQIFVTLGYTDDPCAGEGQPKRKYTLSVRTAFRTLRSQQIFARICSQITNVVTNPCFALVSPASQTIGCDTQNLDYPNIPPPPSGDIWFDSITGPVIIGTGQFNVIHQFDEVPEVLPINSHVSPIDTEQYEECIEPVTGCHPFGPGLIGGQECFDFSFVENVPDSTPCVVIQTITGQYCYYDCTPPVFGYTFGWRQTCDGPLLSHFIETATAPFCTETWNELRKDPLSPADCPSTTFCTVQGGAPRSGQRWYRVLSQFERPSSCCDAAVPCPSDGEPPLDPPEPGVVPWPGGGGGPPPGYVEGWYGGVYCVFEGKWSVVSYAVETEYLAAPLTTPITLCIEPFLFELDASA